jgi:hypothetical protein
LSLLFDIIKCFLQLYPSSPAVICTKPHLIGMIWYGTRGMTRSGSSEGGGDCWRGEGGQQPAFVLYLDFLPSSNAERPCGHHILERISKLCFVDHEMATVRIPLRPFATRAGTPLPINQPCARWVSSTLAWLGFLLGGGGLYDPHSCVPGPAMCMSACRPAAID